MKQKELMFVTVLLALLLLGFLAGKAGITGNAIYEAQGIYLEVINLDYEPGEHLSGTFKVEPELEGMEYKIYVDNTMELEGVAKPTNEFRFLVPGSEGLYTLRVNVGGREASLNFDVIS